MSRCFVERSSTHSTLHFWMVEMKTASGFKPYRTAVLGECMLVMPF